MIIFLFSFFEFLENKKLQLLLYYLYKLHIFFVFCIFVISGFIIFIFFIYIICKRTVVLSYCRKLFLPLIGTLTKEPSVRWEGIPTRSLHRAGRGCGTCKLPRESLRRNSAIGFSNSASWHIWARMPWGGLHV